MVEKIRKIPIQDLDKFATTASGRQILRVKVRQLGDGSYLSMPAAVISDGSHSPRMVLVSGQHGDEWNGPWILHQLTEMVKPDQVRGTLVILPLANPLAFNERSRVAALDGIDLNRTYGIGHPRKPTEHLGMILWDLVFSKTNYLIDLHSAGPGEYLPFAAAPNGKDLDFVKALNFPYIHTPNTTKTDFLVDACQRIGIRAALIEVGGGRTLDRQYHKTVTDGLFNVMKEVGILAGDPIKGTKPYIFKHKYILSAPCAGFFISSIKLGQKVRKGDHIGAVTPLLTGSEVRIQSPRDGLVLYLRREPAIEEQDSIVHII
ncbi:MAG: succinylglutamate desuccinylase/aspartoacylase family protein [Chloroflexota bacterium]|nr:MAG: succinylglutamate desuccinylase/aspartoacylase family protein [Chloroflexota bacterium]